MWRQSMIQAQLLTSMGTSHSDEIVLKNNEWWEKLCRFWRKHILVGREEAWMLRVGSVDTLHILDCQWTHCLWMWVHWQSRMPLSQVRKGAMPTAWNMKDTKGFSDFLVQRGVLTGSVELEKEHCLHKDLQSASCATQPILSDLTPEVLNYLLSRKLKMTVIKITKNQIVNKSQGWNFHFCCPHFLCSSHLKFSILKIKRRLIQGKLNFCLYI